MANAITATYKAKQTVSNYGNPAPQIEVVLKGFAVQDRTAWCQLNARLFAMAAAVELASGEERWVVVVKPGGDAIGWVEIELSNGTDSESKRALVLLQRVLGSRVWS